MSTAAQIEEKMKVKKVMNVFPVLDAGGTEDVILKTSNFLINEKKVTVSILADCSGGRRKQNFIDTGIELFDNPSAKNKKDILGNIRSLKKAATQFKPDIVHTHSIYSLIVAFGAKLLGGDFKIVHTGHGGPTANYDEISRNFSFMADRYITLSRESFGVISRDGKRKNVRLIYNGTSAPNEDELYHGNEPQNNGKLKLGFIGRVTKQKGLPTLIDALGKINQRGIDFELMLVGDGEDRPKLESQVSSLGLSEKVIFNGYSEAPWLLMKDVPIIVMPSLWEQAGLVAIEAMIRNRTVITTSINGLKDVVIDAETGYLFEKLDSEKLADILEELSLGKRKLIHISESKRNEFLFSERTGEKIHDLYEELLQ
ncbi:Glycogen synthase [Serratia entomophila]|uniref:Glycosyltransferase n=1 Tax=Serratia entomophila TaxID=42906 RepID=A0ABY5CY31_9GAMM|nr:glycosyltransferase [Serratia entomophila]UIW19888.1 glycosyltransferase [Serratia entomophila]USV02408.1 glycosyltransferase [Serratia entomophila]CAI0761035.1 Glycogen synthase [Serratia entomophila]CAI0771320.1 Glycogen synthase [Serratia entomophila]CAI0775100.1 Glycogen synthase [Serratia entomophila]